MKRPRPALYTRTPQELGEYVVENARRDDGCLIYTGFINQYGYGEINSVRHLGLAHRLAYEAFVGPIPDGLAIDHLCRNRKCVNPSHLEPVTSAENSRRGGAAVTRCVNGHEYTPENTYRERSGHRKCRACTLERQRRKRAERRRVLEAVR